MRIAYRVSYKKCMKREDPMTTEINWAEFYDPSITRCAMNEPRIIGNLKVATNAKVLIVHPTDEPEAKFEGRFPDFESFLRPMARITEWDDWPSETLLTCSECDSIGLSECDECEGEGCSECDDCGESLCGTCTTTTVEFGPVSITRLYARNISKLPRPVKWGVRADATKDAPVFFTFGSDGRGAVMGCEPHA